MPQCNFNVYSASAGAGKTYRLAAEYIARLLVDPENAYRHILAITFTNKATVEMKERILQNLFDLAHDENPKFLAFLRNETYYAEELKNISDKEVERRASTVMNAILYDYDHFHVSTIDKFFQQLLTNLARELHLPANYRVDINDEEAVREGVERMLKELNQPQQGRVERLRQQKILRWIKAYIGQRLDDNQSWRLSKDLFDFASTNSRKEVYQQRREALEIFLNDERALEGIRDYCRRSIALWDKAKDGSKWQELKLVADQCRRHFLQFADKTDRKGQYLRSFVESPEKVLEGMKVKPDSTPSPTVRKYLSGEKSILGKDYIAVHAAEEEAEVFVGELGTYYSMLKEAAIDVQTAKMVLSTLNPLCLLNEIVHSTDEVNREHNRLMISRTKLLFSKMVEGSDAPFVFERIGTIFHHIMIDEFQDTARTQWDNIKKLLLENISTGNTFMLVGDVKQSIYRFNGGDWKILGNIENEVPKGTPVKVNYMRENHRSEAAIVNFNNLFFEKVAHYYDDIGNTQVIHSIYQKDKLAQKCVQDGNEGYVRLTLFSGSDDKNVLSPENDKNGTSLYAQICRLHDAGVDYKDMAILVRRRAEGKKIIEYFKSQNYDIPFITEEAFYFSSSHVVLLLINVLKYLYSKSRGETNNIALVELLKTYIIDIREESVSLQEIIERNEEILPPELQGDAMRELYRLPLYEMLCRIIQIFEVDKVRNNPRFAGQQAFVLGFLDQVVGFLTEYTSDVRSFLQYWEDSLCKKSIPSTDSDGITIATIHKAKGLAYHTVLIPFCEWDEEAGSPRNKDYLWTKPTVAPYDQFHIFPVELSKKLSMSIFQKDYEEEMLQKRIESINLCYVAFTRPRKNLLIWAVDGKGFGKCMKASVKDNLAGVTLNADEQTDIVSIYEAGRIDTRQVEKKKQESANPFIYNRKSLPMEIEVFSNSALKFRQSNEAAKLLLEADAEETHKKTDDYVDKGILFHKVLESVQTAEDLALTVRKLCLAGTITQKEEQNIVSFIGKRIKSDKVKHWFDGSSRVFNETTLIFKDAGNRYWQKRPDRVMKNGRDIVIVDYKFAKPEDEHKSQVRFYMSLLRKMGYESVMGYLWYVYPNEVIKVENALS